MNLNIEETRARSDTITSKKETREILKEDISLFGINKHSFMMMIYSLVDQGAVDPTEEVESGLSKSIVMGVGDPLVKKKEHMVEKKS